MNTTTTATLCLGPIPDHLRPREWYAPHQAWLRDQGLPHHDPGDADPCRARLDGTILDGASLDDACLIGASLRGASLDGANLVDANLDGIAKDVRDLCYAVPVEERLGLLVALEAGRVNGSTYMGDCACLVGTIAQRRGVDPYKLGADASRPAERWALAIRPGDTPESSEICRLTAQWVQETIP